MFLQQISFAIFVSCVSSCSEIPQIEHGFVVASIDNYANNNNNDKIIVNNYNKFQPGHVLRYQCDRGFQMFPRYYNIAICLKRGWSPLPQCFNRTEIPKCGMAPRVSHAWQRERARFFYIGDQVHYRCKKGFKFEVENATSLICLPKASWTLNHLPRCIPRADNINNNNNKTANLSSILKHFLWSNNGSHPSSLMLLDNNLTNHGNLSTSKLLRNGGLSSFFNESMDDYNEEDDKNNDDYQDQQEGNQLSQANVRDQREQPPAQAQQQPASPAPDPSSALQSWAITTSVLSGAELAAIAALGALLLREKKRKSSQIESYEEEKRITEKVVIEFESTSTQTANKTAEDESTQTVAEKGPDVDTKSTSVDMIEMATQSVQAVADNRDLSTQTYYSDDLSSKTTQTKPAKMKNRRTSPPPMPVRQEATLSTQTETVAFSEFTSQTNHVKMKNKKIQVLVSESESEDEDEEEAKPVERPPVVKKRRRYRQRQRRRAAISKPKIVHSPYLSFPFADDHHHHHHSRSSSKNNKNNNNKSRWHVVHHHHDKQQASAPAALAQPSLESLLLALAGTES